MSLSSRSFLTHRILLTAQKAGNRRAFRFYPYPLWGGVSGGIESGAGGAAERARGPVWYKRPPKAKRRRAAGMQEREKVLANSSFVCYTLFNTKITKKGAAEMKTLHDNKDDNPNIQNYKGRGDINLKYNMDNGAIFQAVFTNNLKFDKTNKSLLELGYLYPIKNSFYLYLSGFIGYSKSLQSYDRYQNAINLGIAFIR